MKNRDKRILEMAKGKGPEAFHNATKVDDFLLDMANLSIDISNRYAGQNGGECSSLTESKEKDSVNIVESSKKHKPKDPGCS